MISARLWSRKSHRGMKEKCTRTGTRAWYAMHAYLYFYPPSYWHARLHKLTYFFPSGTRKHARPLWRPRSPT